MEDKDKELFRNSVGVVVPVKQRDITLEKKKPKAIQKQRYLDEQNVLHELMDDPSDLTDFETGEELLYSRPGFQKKAFNKLRNGQYVVEARLDLHGMIVVEAKKNLASFIQHCHAKGYRCIKIIHGKGLGSKDGKAIIKSKLNYWLQQREDTLAFCSALPNDGGTGAIYLLLRKSKIHD